MCEIATIAGLATAAGQTLGKISFANVLSVGSSVLGMFAGQQQDTSARDMATYNAAVANNNRIISERNARDAEARGREEARLQAQKAADLKSRQLATLAGQGVDVNAGTSVDLLADTDDLARQDIATINKNAGREAAQHRALAMNHGAQSGLHQISAANSGGSSGLRTAAGLLDTVGTVASKWYANAG